MWSKRHTEKGTNLRVLISAGGTGGHIFPALAVAERLRQGQGCELLFVGASGRMEMELVPKAGFSIVGLPIRGFLRKKLWQNLSLPVRLVYSLWRAYIILRRFRPDVLLGSGGYTSWPVVYLGARLGLPALILEPNTVPGWANRSLGKYARKVCVNYTGMEVFFKKHKLIHTGIPLRTELNHLVSAEEGRRQLGLQAELPTLLVLGGSQGASTLNHCLLAGWQQFLAIGYQLIWQTGQAHYTQVRLQLGEVLPKGLYLVPFLDNVVAAYAASTLTVARAGALTIAELLQAGKPAILVPAPHVTDDHQYHNAKALADVGAARCVMDRVADKELIPTIKLLMRDKEMCLSLQKNIARLAPKGNATEAVTHALLRLVKKNSTYVVP